MSSRDSIVPPVLVGFEEDMSVYEEGHLRGPVPTPLPSRCRRRSPVASAFEEVLGRVAGGVLTVESRQEQRLRERDVGRFVFGPANAQVVDEVRAQT